MLILIGNHTYSHRSLIPLSVSNTDFEIMKTDKVIERITGEKPTLFRPPGAFIRIIPENY
ncbi:MAG: polysaccharide deacetylase family protein [Halothermotrichaceae bacterium]